MILIHIIYLYKTFICKATRKLTLNKKINYKIGKINKLFDNFTHVFLDWTGPIQAILCGPIMATDDWCCGVNKLLWYLFKLSFKKT